MSESETILVESSSKQFHSRVANAEFFGSRNQFFLCYFYQFFIHIHIYIHIHFLVFIFAFDCLLRFAFSPYFCTLNCSALYTVASKRSRHDLPKCIAPFSPLLIRPTTNRIDERSGELRGRYARSLKPSQSRVCSLCATAAPATPATPPPLLGCPIVAAAATVRRPQTNLCNWAEYRY